MIFQILCAAGTDESAREVDAQGVFTAELIAALRASPASALLALPLQLSLARACPQICSPAHPYRATWGVQRIRLSAPTRPSS